MAAGSAGRKTPKVEAMRDAFAFVIALTGRADGPATPIFWKIDKSQ